MKKYFEDLTKEISDDISQYQIDRVREALMATPDLNNADEVPDATIRNAIRIGAIPSDVAWAISQ